MITRLVSRGEIFEREDLIVTTFQEHYRILFGSKVSFRVPGYISGCLFQTGRCAGKMAGLSKSFSEKEIKAAVWGLWVEKTLRPGVFSVFFYMIFWDIIKADVFKLMECLHAGTLQLNRFNYASVDLIPKRDEAKEVGDFRPISVLNASVKIISKVLANRLSEVLVDCIDDNLSGFLKGRSILESIAAGSK